MSLPPETVRIKRKKNEDPVDDLYLEQHRDKRCTTEQQYAYRRQGNDLGLQAQSGLSPLQTEAGEYLQHATSQLRAGPPTIRTTLPGEENLPPQRQQAAAHGHCPPAQVGSEEPSSQLNRASPTKLQDPVTATFPRRFHLSKPTSTVPISNPTNGVQKRRKGQRQDVATFIEKSSLSSYARTPAKRAAGRKPEAAPAMESQIIQDAMEAMRTASSAPRKRPNASAVEKHWRAEGLKRREQDQGKEPEASQPNGGARSGKTEMDRPPASLVDSLQRFTLDELQRTQCPLPEALSPRPPTKLRAQPKSNIQRYRDRHPSAPGPSVQAGDMDVDMVDDADYVYDTYVRYRPSASASSVIDGFDGSADGKAFGLLVITEEDQSVWETYIEEEEESDKDWNSEEEDENAEDYHGADYPEDEVASDDEHGRAAYTYRRGASDDEEWDSETGAHSSEHEDDDGEGVLRNPWKRPPWTKAVGGGAGDGEEVDEEGDEN
ncbi:hypothetical protein LTR04_006553 [Oleoguttula sp. CCFEE 6159]|nr:hypothetical protein LTR04_006553 [Oleoguttula sp. CCFEE 6159]